jgi:3'-5' exoribonuclease
MTDGTGRVPAEERSRLWVKDIKRDDRVRGDYLVKGKRMGLTKKGEPFLSLTLADRSGEIEAKVWERAEALSSGFAEGDILTVEGLAGSYRDQVQITLSNLTISRDEADPALFWEASSKDIGQMLAALREVLRNIKNAHLKALVGRFFSDREFLARFKTAPAAKNFHHCYVGGLLEHTLSVCEMATSVLTHYPELDRGLLLTGAFLHDIGKIKELKFDHQIEYTDEGRLVGHIVLGVEMVAEKQAKLRDFPPELAMRLKHLILSHHGQFEFGSPKRPKFLEAFALHLIDDLDAKMNGLSRFMAKDRQPGAWTEFNRLFERYFLKGDMLVGEEETPERPPLDNSQKTLFNSYQTREPQ